MKRWLLALCLILYAGSSEASTLFVTGGASSMERDFLQTIQHQTADPVVLPALLHHQKPLLGLIAPGLGNATYPVTRRSFPQSTTLADVCREVEVVVAIGQAAAEASLEACTVPVLTVLMTRLQWHRLVENTRHRAVSAIDWEADPVLNLRLIRQLMPRAVRIGIFVSPHTEVWLPPLRREAERLGMELVEMPVTTDEDAVLAHRIGRRLSTDIRNAARAIERIKGGDRNVQLAKTATHEIGTLQEGVNLLAEAVASAQEKLEKELAKVRGEYQQTLDELRDQTRKAEQANQAKSQFLAKISHEMRTPLYSIQGLAEQLLKTRHDAGEVRTLRTLLTATANLYQTISDILDFTQLEKGKFVPAATPLHLWDEIESVVETVGPLLSRQHLYVDVIVASSVPATVIGDGRAFRTIVSNRMSNAMKFTETGGIVIRLEVDLAADTVVPIRLQISDTGRGIPPDKLSSIFAPFEQAEGALNRRYAGTGLGLSIVQGYCEALGGRIEVASRPGQSATFTVYLPFRKHPTGPDSVDQPAFAALSGFNMLVVDARASFCASVACRLASLNVNSASRVMPIQDLNAMAPPALPYDVLIVRDLTLLDPEILTPLRGILNRWARQVVSLTTGDELPSAQEYRRYGIDAVLWSGASRATLYEELKTVVHGEQPISEPEPDNPALRSLLAGKRILVVEDFAINRNIMADQLQHHGLRVIEAESGEEAVAKASTCSPDLILMDIQMPGMDGIQAIQAIRSLPACAELPIIGFTASADKPTHRQVMAAGANRVLTKPLSETDLIGAIYQLLAPSAAET